MSTEYRVVDLDELDRLEKRATQGTWWADEGSIKGVHRPSIFTSKEILFVERDHSDQRGDDAFLIVHMRNALPHMVAELRELRKERDETRTALLISTQPLG